MTWPLYRRLTRRGRIGELADFEGWRLGRSLAPLPADPCRGQVCLGCIIWQHRNQHLLDFSNRRREALGGARSAVNGRRAAARLGPGGPRLRPRQSLPADAAHLMGVRHSRG
jgi:hypothetical protein